MFRTASSVAANSMITKNHALRLSFSISDFYALSNIIRIKYKLFKLRQFDLNTTKKINDKCALFN